MALFQYFKMVDGNYPGTKLPDPQGALSKEVPSSLISAANTEIATVLQPSAAGVKVVRGTYLKINAENKAEIGQHAAVSVAKPGPHLVSSCPSLTSIARFWYSYAQLCKDSHKHWDCRWKWDIEVSGFVGPGVWVAVNLLTAHNFAMHNKWKISNYGLVL